MKTMVEVTVEFLINNDDKAVPFKKIWGEVNRVKRGDWKKDEPKVLIKVLESRKRAELYTLLTVSGRFVRTENDKFGLVSSFTFNEVKKMKVNVGEEL